jgi:hypothetical protein
VFGDVSLAREGSTPGRDDVNARERNGLYPQRMADGSSAPKLGLSPRAP